MNRLLDTIREMVMTVARLEKRPLEAEILAKATEPERTPPLPPPIAQFPQVPIAPSTLGLYEILALRMPVGVPLFLQAGSKAVTVRP